MKNYLIRNDQRNNEADLFEDMFGDFFKPMFYDEASKNMATDIKENENGYEMDVEMPGFKKEDISLDYEKGYLTVSAKSEHKEEEGSGKHRYIRQERRSVCRRSYYIGEVSEENIKAKYDNGVLQVLLPKKTPEKVENKKIMIE